jgi:hypothetical protein
MISGGMLGTPRQSYWPNKARAIFVNTLAAGTPPLSRMQVLANCMKGSSAETPESFKAK